MWLPGWQNTGNFPLFPGMNGSGRLQADCRTLKSACSCSLPWPVNALFPGSFAGRDRAQALSAFVQRNRARPPPLIGPERSCPGPWPVASVSLSRWGCPVGGPCHPPAWGVPSPVAGKRTRKGTGLSVQGEAEEDGKGRCTSLQHIPCQTRVFFRQDLQDNLLCLFNDARYFVGT